MSPDRDARERAIRQASEIVQEGANPFVRHRQDPCTCWQDGQELTTSSETECPEHGDKAWSGLRALSDERLLDLLAQVRSEVRRRDPGPDAEEIMTYAVLAEACGSPIPKTETEVGLRWDLREMTDSRNFWRERALAAEDPSRPHPPT